MRDALGRVEWPTLGMIALCYAGWILGLSIADITLWLAVPIVALAIALQSSLQHEVLHGHPFRCQGLNTLLVFPSLNLAIPYLRFRETHLAHHRSENLTDPYDDPESNYLDPAVWRRMSRIARFLLHANGTLLGRILLGPLIGQVTFVRREWQDARHDPRVRQGWLWHVPATAAVAWLVALSPMPFWAYLIAAYAGLGLVKIRTFAEHRAHSVTRCRSVVIEDRGPLALLFLNNNLHVVHHMHPSVPWYRLPALYVANRRRFLAVNGAYVFRSYAALFRAFAIRAKDPVPHPLRPE